MTVPSATPPTVVNGHTPSPFFEAPRSQESETSRGEEVSRGGLEVKPEEFSRGSLDEPLESERSLNSESERIAKEVEHEYSRDSRSGVRRVMTDSKVMDLFEAPMRQGLYGVTQMDKFPFRVVINSRVMKPRQAISLVHEMLHVFARLHKMDSLPHDKLHDLSIFIFSEILPALRKFTNEGEHHGGR